MDDDPLSISLNSPLPLLLTSAAAAATALCFLFLRCRPSRSLTMACSCPCSCGSKKSNGREINHVSVLPNGEAAEKETASSAPPQADRQTGGSMMEQLVPEITTHALSYLDYPSLCRLSMTNSWMRKAANDDGAWKALYHKDFTMEQDNITPINGWKAYYAATKAIVDLNAEFYHIISEGSLPAMSRFWLRGDYVKCIRASGELFTGYTPVMNSWSLAFNWEQGGQGIAFTIRDVRVRVLTDMAWVTMKAYVDSDAGPFHMTNIYEFHNGRWYMVHHHSSVMLMDEDEGQHNVFG